MVEEPLLRLTPNTGEQFYYRSICSSLQSRVVEDCKEFPRDFIWIRSSEDITEITFKVTNDPYFQQLGRPDFTRYTIDFKVWQLFFGNRGGKNAVPFTAVNPLIARPLSGRINLSSLPPNSFPVVIPVMDYTNPFDTVKLRDKIDSIETESGAGSDATLKQKYRDGEQIERQDSGYQSIRKDSPVEAEQSFNAEKPLAVRRRKLVAEIEVAKAQARDCEDKSVAFDRKASKLIRHKDRLEAQLLALDETEEEGFKAEKELQEAISERDILDDKIKRLVKFCEENSL